MNKKIIMVLFALFYSLNSLAELTLVGTETIADSEEPFARRLYSYDFDVSSDGVVHAVYSKPIVGSDLAQIIYMSKNVGGNWPTENNRTVLEGAGRLSSISTNLIYDNASSTVHISYIVARDFIDSNGDTHNSGLVYQKIVNTNLSEKINISSGGFHSLMQINENGVAIFIREYEDFLNADGSIRSQPFPKALRIQLPLANNQWTDRTHILNLPASADYRLANFIVDSTTGRYHIAYGNKNADFLRAAFPTTNPPTTENAVFFPPGEGHDLIYAYSDDLFTWHSSTIDGSGTLSENEFWTDLIVHQGQVNSASYRYKTDEQGIHQGTSAVLGTLSDQTWSLVTVAGNTTGASAHRAGAAAKIIRDENGGFHGVWDNSPDAPIDSESAKGTTLYRYSPDGLNWETRQAILAFSVEGKIRAKIHNNRLLIMFLGDATDARLVFSEFNMPTLTASLMEISTDKMFYGLGETINLHARLQGNQQALSDLYFVVTGPFDQVSSGELTPTTTTAFYYFGSDFGWHVISDLIDAQPVLTNFSLVNIHDFFSQSTAQSTVPFNTSGRYRLYSLAVEAGTPLQNLNVITPLYSYDLHVCNLANCAEIIQ